MGKQYSLTEVRKKEYAGVFVLEYMINRPKAFPLLLEGNDQDLELVLEWLLLDEYVEMRDEEKYVPTQKGRKLIERFVGRYSEFLNAFDVFCAVDLEKGEFAFSSYFEFDDVDQWRKHLNRDHWEDLRIAVAEYKKMDPVEIVFMSFINEGRFGRDATGWQFDLLLGTIWDEILEICNSAIHWEQLGYTDEEGEVPAEDVIESIIVQGAELVIELHEKEADLSKTITDDGNDEDDDDEHYVERVYPEDYPPDYYYHYRDPFYVSPLFLALLIL